MIEHICKTIDIKVQSILFELNQEINEAKERQPIPRSPYLDIDVEKDMKVEQKQHCIPSERKGEMLQKIENCSEEIGRLLTLKSKVSINNFELIHCILSNNYYLEFSSKELSMIVEGRAFRQSA